MISVIIPVYKVEKYLPYCVNSVLNQSYGHLEIIFNYRILSNSMMRKGFDLHKYEVAVRLSEIV